MAALRPRLRLPGQSAARQNLGDIGDADTQQGRDPADRLTIVRRGKDAFAKILRIGFAPSPKHADLRCSKTGHRRIVLGGVSEPPFLHGCDSSQGGSALTLYTPPWRGL